MSGVIIGRELGKVAGKALPKMTIPGERFGLPETVEGGPVSAPPYQAPVEPAPVYPGAALPGVPSPELLQARGLEQGGHAPAPEPAAALADLPVHAVHKAIQELGPQASVADITTRANQIAKLGDLLNDAVGGKPLKPNVPLKNQLDVPAPAPAVDVLEGHTPVDSSALKSYKYDPTTKEFETVTPSGGHYIYGDVSPDQVQAFEAADSKGKAWNEIRKNSTLVGKVVNGKRVNVRPPTELQTAGPEDTQVPAESVARANSQGAKNTPQARQVVVDPKTGKPEFSDVIAARSGSPEADLTGPLQQMLDEALRKNKKKVGAAQ